jgi:hypothetical protein
MIMKKVSMRLEEQELGAVLACFPKKYNPAAWPTGLIPSQPSPHGLDSAKAIYGVGGMGGPAKGCVDLGGRGYCRADDVVDPYQPRTFFLRYLAAKCCMWLNLTGHVGPYVCKSLGQGPSNTHA